MIEKKDETTKDSRNNLGRRRYHSTQFLFCLASGVLPCVAAIGVGGEEERVGGLRGDWDAIQ